MKINKLLFSTLIISFMLLFFFFKPEGKKQNIRVYPSDNPAERVVWERLRLADPNTGEIPRNMHRKERMFAKTLPQANTLIKANWVHRGPYNVGGRTRGFALDILDEKTLFAGGASGGMFRSIDAGLSWSMTTHPNQLHNVTCVAQDTRVGKEHIWYFGSGELRGSSASGGEAYYQGNGIYKSTDGGLSWDSLSITATNTPQSFDSDFDFIWNLKTDPSNDSLDVLYAATYGTIYRSQDGGNTWQQELGGGSSYYTNVDITSNGTVYATLSTGSSAATNKGIWRSADGQNWTNILDTAFPLIYGRIAIGINPSNENEVYFLAAETDGYGQHTDVFFGGETWTSLWKYTYLSGDGSGLGGQWTDLSLNIPANQNTSFDNFNAQGGYDLLVKVHPSNPDVVFIGGTNLWRSTDGFTSPNNTIICGGYLIGSYEGDGNWGIYPNHHPDQHDLWFLPSNDSVMLSATDGGVYISSNAFEDTVKWVSLNNGYYTSQLYAATISRNANSNVLHGGFQDNGNFITFSGNPNKHWHMPFNGDGAYAGIADNEEDFYLSIQRGVMYKMKLDTNAHRISFNRMDPVSTDSTKYLFINPLVMDENSDIIYLANGNNLWRNNNISNIPYNNAHVKSDFGWERFTDSLPNPLMRISVIETSVNPPNIVYYGTKNKYVYRVDNAHIGDPPHTQLSGILTGQNSFCSDIAINPLDADEVMVVYSNYSVYSLFHSMDGGVTWSKVAGNLEQNNSGSGNGPSCRTAKIIPLGNDTLYLVGTSVGLFGTSELDGLNTTWRQIAKSEIGNVVIETLTYRAADKLLVVATHGNGIYSINLNNVGTVLGVEDQLYQDGSDIKIYPNPTQGDVKLDLTIDNSMDISWVVYSETGRIVQSKKVKKAISGNNQISVSLNGLSSGMYYITLNVGERKITRKIIKK